MQTIIDYMSNHHDELFFMLAAIILLIELSIMGLSGILLFIGLGFFLTGIMNSIGLVTTWEFEVLSVGIFSLTSALVLWKPLKRIQGSKHPRDNSSDMIGQTVLVSNEVTSIGGSIRYSGINWQAKLSKSTKLEKLEIDSTVEICAVEGTVMIVREID